MQVRGVENLPLTVGSYDLPPTARLIASVVNASVPVLGFHRLIDIPAGTSGLMLAAMIDITLYGPNASRTNSLEGEARGRRCLTLSLRVRCKLG
jgi:hypothetical protein